MGSAASRLFRRPSRPIDALVSRRMRKLGEPSIPTMRRPGGLMKPRSPWLLLFLLILTLVAIWFWGSV